jgi:hypothetical protein
VFSALPISNPQPSISRGCEAKEVPRVRLTSPNFQVAEQLIRRLGPAQNLRTLDALQLAAALDLRGRGLVTQFVCADQRLCAFAVAEGLSVVNPELP